MRETAGIFSRACGLGGRISGLGLDGSRVAGRSAVHGIDLQHLGDRSHPRNRLFREFTNAKGKRARQFAVEVNWAAAHASHNARVFDFRAVQAHQNHIALGSIDVFHDAQDFNFHGLGLDTLKNCVRETTHARVDLVHRNGFKGFRILSCDCGGQQPAECCKRENYFPH